MAARRRRGRRSRGNEENDVRKREGKQRRSGKQIFWTEERVYTRKLIRTWRAAMEGREAASVCVVECRTADRHTIHSRPCRRFFPPSFPFFFFLSFSLSLFLSLSPSLSLSLFHSFPPFALYSDSLSLSLIRIHTLSLSHLRFSPTRTRFAGWCVPVQTHDGVRDDHDHDHDDDDGGDDEHVSYDRSVALAD